MPGTLTRPELTASDHGAAADAPLDQPLVAEPAIRRLHSAAVDAERRGQLARRREPAVASEKPALDAPLQRVGELIGQGSRSSAIQLELGQIQLAHERANCTRVVPYPESTP